MEDRYGVHMKKVKRFRSAFTTEQVNYLEKEYQKYPYIGNARRKDVSNVLNIPERAVKIWFQNRRMKEKKEVNPKETNEAKAVEMSDELLNTGRALSTNDPYSLPILTTNDEDLEPKCDKTAVANDRRQVPVSNESLQNDKLITKPDSQPTVLNNIPSSSITESQETQMRSRFNDSDTIKLKQETRCSPLDRNSPKADQMRFNPYMKVPLSKNIASQPKTAKILPQPAHIQPKPEDSQIYLKGFYQPYLPPGNVIWKPINVAPVMPTGVPPVTIPNGFPIPQNMMKRSCNCDCHSKPFVTPMQFGPNSNPHLQYVIAAVPFQNTPKF